MNPLPVAAGRLRHRVLLTDGDRISNASLFPFFDSHGRVKWMMILREDSTGIDFLPWVARGFRVTMWGPIRLTGVVCPLRGVAYQQVAGLADLWHFDPWCTLADQRYAGQPAARCLLTTNCAGRFARNVTTVCFRRDLSRLKWVTIREKSGIELVLFRPALLPARPPAPAPALRRSSPPAWHLAPVWQVWS